MIMRILYEFFYHTQDLAFEQKKKKFSMCNYHSSINQNWL
jgi:hypothetical protein